MNLSTYPSTSSSLLCFDYQSLGPGATSTACSIPSPALALLRPPFYHCSYSDADSTLLFSLQCPSANETKDKSLDCSHKIPWTLSQSSFSSLTVLHSVFFNTASILAFICPLNLMRTAHSWTFAAA